MKGIFTYSNMIILLTLFLVMAAKATAQPVLEDRQPVVEARESETQATPPNRDAQDDQSSKGTESQPFIVKIEEVKFGLTRALELLVPVFAAFIAAGSALFAILYELRIKTREEWRAKVTSAISLAQDVVEKGRESLIVKRVALLVDAGDLLLPPVDSKRATKRIQLEEWREEWTQWQNMIYKATLTLYEIAASARNRCEALAVVKIRDALSKFDGALQMLVEAKFAKMSNLEGDWDIVKAKENLQKHRATFQETVKSLTQFLGDKPEDQ
jgi:hypothetical protein